MRNLCIIPARGGSKRIPRKNIKEFLGKPIIAYSIEVALTSGLFDEVMVSTDDIEIATIAQKYGAQIPFQRSAKNADDFATTYDVIEEVLDKYQGVGKSFDNICCIYSCAPLVSISSLKEAYEHLIKKQYASVFPIIEYSTPIQRALKLQQNQVKMFYPQFINTRSQDLEKAYFDAGQFYWLNVKEVLASKQIYSKNSGAIIINEMNAQDIDNENDWKIAEIKYQLNNKKSI